MQRTVPGALIAASIVLLTTGCGSASDAPTNVASESVVAVASPTMPVAPETPVAPVKKPQGRNVAVTNDLFEFEYSYPAAVGAIPGLKAEMDRRLETSRAQLAKESKEAQAEAVKNDYPYHSYSSTAAWAVVADLPRWLSLSAEMYSYSGGAHGMAYFDGLIWDKQAGRTLKAIDLFVSKAALSKTIRTRFCDALDKQRAERRDEPVVRDNGDMFNECIDPTQSTLILGSSNGKTFDRIGVLVAPYAAGPYVEGTFELTLPVTQAVIATVKPEYRGEFSVGK